MIRTVIASLSLLAGVAQAQTDPDADRLEAYTPRPLRGVEVSALAWQAGLWRSADGDSWQYVSCPRGGMQLGLQQDLREGRTRFFEFQRYEERDGGIVFQAQPLGRAPTPFVLIEAAESRAVFENTGHDFPQRIILERHGEVLSGRIEGREDGVAKSAEWSWRLADSAGCQDAPHADPRD